MVIQEEDRRMGTENEARGIATFLANQFTQLSIKDEKNSIPIFSGNTMETSVRDWLQECLTYATIYKWKAENYREIFGSRLRGEALNFHVQRMRYFPTESFASWSKELKRTFQTPMDIERLKLRFNELRQTPVQQVQHFIDKVARTYDSIYGRAPTPRQGQAQTEQPTVRGDTLLKIFMNGVLPPIKDMMLNANLFDVYSWEAVTKAALKAERLTVARQLAVPATVNKISAENEELFNAIMKKNQDIENKMTAFFSTQGAGRANPAAYSHNAGGQQRGRGNF